MSDQHGHIHEQEFQIREQHLDTFGHVNNAAYLEILEEARWNIVNERGFSLQQVQEKQVGPTILEVNLKFRRELKNRERIRIRTWVTGRDKKLVRLRQVMVNSAGADACIADFVLGLFDLKARKLIDPTPEFLYAINYFTDSAGGMP